MESDKKQGVEEEKNWYKSLVGQLGSILTMVMTGARKLKDVVAVLQIIIAEEKFAEILLGASQKVVAKVENALLTLVGTITLTSKKRKSVEIVARLEKLGVYCHQSFKNLFDGIMVGGHKSSTLAYHTLNRNAWDSEILLALGGEKNAETSVEDFLSLVERQLAGENVFLADGEKNIFYIRRDPSSALCAVYVGWYDDQWDVDADELDDGYWRSLCWFFSRKSCS